MDIPAKPWEKYLPPKRILAIRLQAMGDTIITLPYLQALRDSLPIGTTLDFLTRKEVGAIPLHLILFNKVYQIGGGRNAKRQFLSLFLLLPKLILRRYDVVIDLQNNSISRLANWFITPVAWSQFDRFSPIAAGERTRLTIEAIGLGNNIASNNLVFSQKVNVEILLKKHGWNGGKLIILNPAGAFSTRNWPLHNYIGFAERWLKTFPQTQFLIVGTAFIAEKAAYLKQQLGNQLIDLTEKTTPVEAFAIVKKAELVLSEDSGLMHMSWILGTPTVALFGSTRSDWSAPLGKHTLLFSSNNLPCGNCLLQNCKYGDVNCLTRYTPQFIFDQSLLLLQSLTTSL